MEEKDQELLTSLALDVIHLKDLMYAVMATLQKKTGVTNEELRAMVQAARLARRDVLNRSAESPEQSIVRFLEEFEGSEQ